ncbi:MAG: iaaA, partial [Spartobacteria bacterium]|nr:iaaA [Spartobacteria bacterium]
MPFKLWLANEKACSVACGVGFIPSWLSRQHLLAVVACMRSRNNCFLALALLIGATAAATQEKAPEQRSIVEAADMQRATKTVGLVIHGGAGTIDRAKMTAEREGEYRSGLERSLRAGYEILQRGG